MPVRALDDGLLEGAELGGLGDPAPKASTVAAMAATRLASVPLIVDAIGSPSRLASAHPRTSGTSRSTSSSARCRVSCLVMSILPLGCSEFFDRGQQPQDEVAGRRVAGDTNAAPLGAAGAG